jgi:hypothetical protein
MYLIYKSDGVRGERRKLYDEGLNDLYCSPNIVRVIKSRRMSGGRERCAQIIRGDV